MLCLFVFDKKIVIVEDYNTSLLYCRLLLLLLLQYYPNAVFDPADRVKSSPSRVVPTYPLQASFEFPINLPGGKTSFPDWCRSVWSCCRTRGSLKNEEKKGKKSK